MIRSLAAALALSAFALATPAAATELTLGVYAHDVTFIGNAVGLGAAGREDGADVQLGIRSRRIDAWTWLGKPQAEAVVSVNSQGTSDYVSASLTWPIHLTDRFYFRPGFGLAYTDGKTGLPPVNAPGLSPAEIQRRLHLYNTRIDFGSKVLFNPALAFGAHLTDRLSAELSYSHLSNGQIFHQGKNQGLDDAGVRLVYSFGPRGYR